MSNITDESLTNKNYLIAHKGPYSYNDYIGMATYANRIEINESEKLYGFLVGIELCWFPLDSIWDIK